MKSFVSILFFWILFLIAGNASFAQDSTSSITIGVSEYITSKFLGEQRIINIYLPSGYKKDDSTTYPVIYLPDGGLEEDFIHICGLIQFNSQPWVNRLAKSIVVGIQNTNRQRDFTFPVTDLDFLEKMGFNKKDMPVYGGSSNYLNFIEKELIPFITSKYKGNSHRTIIGESLAGLLLTQTLFERPGFFENYIIISPSLWWGNESLLSNNFPEKANATNQKFKVYLGIPAKNDNEIMYDDGIALSKILAARTDIEFFFDYLPTENHATIMHQATYNALKSFYPLKK